MLMRNAVCMLLSLVLLAYDLSAQKTLPSQRELTGRVVSSDNSPVPNATIIVKGLKKSTAITAGEDGRFTIPVPEGRPVTLIVSAVGHDTREIRVDEARNDLNITLDLNTKGLNEVVVIGYGTARKKDLTGSVATVSVKDQEKIAVNGTAQMLEGQVAGVIVTENQTQPGGSVFSIRIRGTNSITSSSEPLYVLDGYAGADVSNLNAADIQSIDVLKDASATAIYGSRGANGVILITTKRGRNGGRQVNVDAFTGIQQVSKRYDMMNATQYGIFLDSLQSQQNQLQGTNLALPYTTQQISSFGKGTDWQDAIFKTAPVSSVTAGFAGGGPDSRSYLSFNYYQQQGIIIGSNFKRGILRYNIDQDFSSKLKMGLSSQFSYGYQNVPSVNTSGGGTTPSVLWDAVRFNPILPVRDSSGKYTYMNTPGPLASPLGNPVAYANEAQDGIYNFRAFATSFLEYEVIRGLKLKTSLGVDYRNMGEKQFVPTDLYVAASNGGSASQSTGQYYNYLNENTVTYDKEINHIHAINAVAGFTFQHWYNKSSSAGITNLSTNNEGADNLGIGTAAQPSSSFTENVLASYFGRINYRLMDKYLFTFTMRADGSSRFGVNNKWGYFPSGAFAWHVSDEKFISRIKSISELKLRTSYGVTGNQEIGSYNSLSMYSSNAAYSMGTGPSRVVGTQPSNIANPNLKWESTSSFDLGLDLGLWDNRLMLTADYYYKKTSNLLLNISIPQTSGYSSILENIGAVQNQGFELAVTTRNVNQDNFKWTTTLNFSTNANKVLNLGPNKQIYAGDLSGSVFPSATFKSAILLVGKPIGAFYGYIFDGIWQTQDQITKSGTKQAVKPGDPIYRDLTGDSALSGADRTILGHALPKFTYGMSNTFTYGKWQLKVFIQGVYGNNILNENLYEIQNGSNNFNRLAYIGTKSWTGPGTSNTNARISSVLRRSTGVTSDVIENGSYLRFKTVTLSYDLPLPKASKVFRSSSVYVTAQNLITITRYTGYDPEVNSFSTSNALSLGTDYNAYPHYRTYLLGIKLGF